MNDTPEQTIADRVEGDSTGLRRSIDRARRQEEPKSVEVGRAHVVGSRSQTIYLDPRRSDASDIWVAWTKIGPVDAADDDFLDDAAREHAAVSFYLADGDIRLRTRLDTRDDTTVWIRLIHHLARVADRLEFRVSHGGDRH